MSREKKVVASIKIILKLANLVHNTVCSSMYGTYCTATLVSALTSSLRLTRCICLRGDTCKTSPSPSRTHPLHCRCREEERPGTANQVKNPSDTFANKFVLSRHQFQPRFKAGLTMWTYLPNLQRLVCKVEAQSEYTYTRCTQVIFLHVWCRFACSVGAY